MKPEEIAAFEAKARLSELLDRVREGRVYHITQRGKAVAELRPLQTANQRQRRGVDRGRVVVREDFDMPLHDFKRYTK